MIDFTWTRREKILGITAVCLIVLLIISLFWNKNEADPMEAALKNYQQVQKKEANVNSKQVAEVWVDVKGAIHKPGIYKMKSSSRIFEVIEQAGGVLNNADLNQVNLAQILTDGIVVYIPRKGEKPQAINTFTSSSSNTGKVNINTATEQELVALHGIGPSKAKAIIQYRTEHGRFQSIEELKKISGLGEKTLAKFKDQITVH